MFFDTLATADSKRYPPRIVAALDWLKAQDFDVLPAGVVEIDGRAMFAQILDVHSKRKEELLPERHRRYIDVQYLHRGHEIMGVAIETGNNAVAQEYDETRDILFYQQAENESFFTLQPGQFTVFFPEDIHRSTITEGQSRAIRKIVVKVALDSL